MKKNTPKQKKETPYIGVLQDTRTPKEKESDWDAREIFAFGSPVFRTVQLGDWATYTRRTQDGSGSCVANSQSKRCEVAYTKKHGAGIKFSHAPVYINRSNKPQGGMGYPDAPKLQVKMHTCLESEMPSENMNDAQLDALKLPVNFEEINDTARPNAYTYLPLSFNDVAYHTEQNGGAIIWVTSDYKNWDKGIPTVGGKGGSVRHSICVVDAITYNGVRYLVIEDSWGNWGNGRQMDALETLLAERGQRLVSEDFFKDGVFLAYDLLSFTYEQEQPQPFAPFKVRMQYGQTNTEVARLQDYLRAKGLFPQGTKSTGYYGNITAQSVLAFQIKYSVDNIAVLNSLKGRFVGPKTLQVINKYL